MASAGTKSSINRKLTRLVLMSVGCACALMASFSGWQESSRYVAAKRAELRAAASAFGAAASGAVAANDRHSAMLALRGIVGLPGLEHVAVRDTSGAVVAEVGSGARLAGDLILDDAADPSLLSLFATTTVSFDGAMYNNGHEVGRITLVSNTMDLTKRLFQVLGSAFAASAVASIISLAIASRMKKRMTAPLLRLTSLMAQIRSTHAYDLAVDVQSNDEIGLMASGFRSMIEEVRERDQRLIKHKQQLESDVDARTHELVLAKKDAESANNAKSDFLATMSHEVRTPLNGLLVMADLLAEADLPAGPQRYAQIVSQSGHALLSIINDILDFSKIEAGKMTLEQVEFDPHDVVDRVLMLHAMRAQEQGIDLAGYVDPRLPDRMTGDPTRLSQILSNLVSNAIKFTARGSVVVRLDQRGSDLVFCVTDTGIGIPADKLNTVFDAFSQAEQSTSRRFGGTGLGLAICKRLASAMSAGLEVSSEEGRGSSFKLTIPGAATRTASIDVMPQQKIYLEIAAVATRALIAEKLAAFGFMAVSVASQAQHTLIDISEVGSPRIQLPSGKVIALSHSGVTPGTATTPHVDLIVTAPIRKSDWKDIIDLLSGRGVTARESRSVQRAAIPGAALLRVLVVDDTSLNLEIAVAALSKFGVRADTCSSGPEAVTRVAEQPFDLVLMDGSMPDMDGYEATRLIRVAEGLTGAKRTRIVALTAHVLGPSADAWRDCGMDAVLHKPFTMRALEAILLATPGSDVASASSVVQSGDQDPTLLDPQTLESLLEMAERSGSSFLGRILSLFIDGCAPAMQEIKAGSAAGDASTVAAAAHRLRSMSLNVGAIKLAGKLQAVESGARGTVFPTEHEMESIEQLIPATTTALRSSLEAPHDRQVRLSA